MNYNGMTRKLYIECMSVEVHIFLTAYIAVTAIDF